MGGPGYLEKALKSIRLYVVGWFMFSGCVLVGIWFAIDSYLTLGSLVTAGILTGSWLILSLLFGLWVASRVSKPLQAISQAIMHVSPSPLPVPPPEIEKLKLAKDLIANLTRQVYDYATQTAENNEIQSAANLGIQQLPVPVFGIDSEANIIYANPKAQEFAKSNEGLAGKNLYSHFDILFQNEDTLENWIESCRAESVTAQKTWHGIRMSPYEQEVRYCDLAASYVKSSEKGRTEVVITLLDETDKYIADDEGLSFVALAVHELRTPLTILRGYVEVFEDELSKDLSPDMQDFMQKMRVAAENLTDFVGNILNVARVEQDQLSLKLTESDWKETLTSVIDNIRLKAKVHGKTIELTVPDNLPKVALDKISISEVIINLVDNAIKYSPKDKTLIKVMVSLTKDNLVETIIQDYGVGIPETVVPHLFEKYSRNHRNRSTVSGSGLGLYLSKALITAHGGNIWVRSKEGEGTVFGFTLIPYDQLADEEKAGDNKEITRNAHGWIKNHSLSRQ